MKHNNVAKHAHKYNKSSVHMDKKRHSKLNAPWQMDELRNEEHIDQEDDVDGMDTTAYGKGFKQLVKC